MTEKNHLCFLCQVYTSHGPTVVMPTWFCSRSWFSKVGPFDTGGKVRLPTRSPLCLHFFIYTAFTDQISFITYCLLSRAFQRIYSSSTRVSVREGACSEWTSACCSIVTMRRPPRTLWQSQSYPVPTQLYSRIYLNTVLILHLLTAARWHPVHLILSHSIKRTQAAACFRNLDIF